MPPYRERHAMSFDLDSMAKRYHDEVGPWLPYLPVLTDHETPRS